MRTLPGLPDKYVWIDCESHRKPHHVIAFAHQDGAWHETEVYSAAGMRAAEAARREHAARVERGEVANGLEKLLGGSVAADRAPRGALLTGVAAQGAEAQVSTPLDPSQRRGASLLKAGAIRDALSESLTAEDAPRYVVRETYPIRCDRCKFGAWRREDTLVPILDALSSEGSICVTLEGFWRFSNRWDELRK